jgi:hypothetical protein
MIRTLYYVYEQATELTDDTYSKRTVDPGKVPHGDNLWQQKQHKQVADTFEGWIFK